MAAAIMDWNISGSNDLYQGIGGRCHRGRNRAHRVGALRGGKRNRRWFDTAPLNSASGCSFFLPWEELVS